MQSGPSPVNLALSGGAEALKLRDFAFDRVRRNPQRQPVGVVSSVMGLTPRSEKRRWFDAEAEVEFRKSTSRIIKLGAVVARNGVVRLCLRATRHSSIEDQLC